MCRYALFSQAQSQIVIVRGRYAYVVGKMDWSEKYKAANRTLFKIGMTSRGLYQ